MADLCVMAGVPPRPAGVVRPGIEDQSEMDWVEAATQSATDSGVRDTPTVLLNGKVVEAGRLHDLAARTR